MLRIRSVKPEILLDEKVAAQESDAWRLYASMIFLADDYGNLHADPKLLAAEVFWALNRRVEVRPLLDDLVAAELITFYRVRGQSYVNLRGWKKHQKVDHPGKPRVPGPTEADPPEVGTKKEVPHTRRATDSRESRETLATDQDQDQDQDRTEREADFSFSPALALRAAGADQKAKALLTFPTVRGKRSGALEWHLTETEAQVFRDGFPDLDVLAEARKARLWLLSDRKRRKTSDGMMRFLTGWLGRAQNRGGARIATATARTPSMSAPGKAPEDLCSFHREIRDKPSTDVYRWCSLCRKLGERERRTGESEPTPIGEIP